jgi:acyl-CoA reductase-like NAD-dependent aldehyde dehydrogenase
VTTPTPTQRLDRYQVVDQTQSILATPPPGQVIGGAEVSGSGPVVIDEDPGLAQPLAAFASASPEEVDHAVRSGREAFDDGRWSGLDADERERLMHIIADHLERDREVFTDLESLDTGKPREQAAADINEAISVIRYFGGWATKAEGSVIPAPAGLLAYTTREPLGVCAAITPWNYPLPILTYKLAPALAMGNSVVAKPSELAPLSTLVLARLALEAGLPDGVFNVVTGAGATGSALAGHHDLDKVAFTGSTVTGRRVMQAASASPTRVSLELGGKSAHIVFADADMNAAAEAVMAGIWTNAGQVCIAGSRLLVEHSVHDDFVELVVSRTRDLKLGHGLSQGVDMGPLISASQKSRVLDHIGAAHVSGARAVIGGTESDLPGHFVDPTVFVDVRPGSAIEQEEVFGPVLAVSSFRDEDEAIRFANSTRYGLAAGLWTSSVGRAHRLGRRLRAGTVWVNTYGIFHPTLPFGGVRGSGFGRELGSDAVGHYSETKTTVLDPSS